MPDTDRGVVCCLGCLVSDGPLTGESGWFDGQSVMETRGFCVFFEEGVGLWLHLIARSLSFCFARLCWKRIKTGG